MDNAARMALGREWSKSDAISDKIVDILNQEVEAGTTPLQILVGQLFGLKATLQNLPKKVPLPIVLLDTSVDQVLSIVLRDSIVYSVSKAL